MPAVRQWCIKLQALSRLSMQKIPVMRGYKVRPSLLLLFSPSPTVTSTLITTVPPILLYYVSCVIHRSLLMVLDSLAGICGQTARTTMHPTP